MATNFPTSIDTFTNPTSGNPVTSPSHSSQHANANDSIAALEAKVGANSSAVTSSHDYKLSGVTGTDKAASKTGIETFTNKTLTSPIINTASITSPTIDTFANSNHNHQDAAGGGQLNATSVFSSGVVPVARLPGFACGLTTRDLSLITAQTIAHGLGATPRFVKVTLYFANSVFCTTAFAVYTNATGVALYVNIDTNTGANNSFDSGTITVPTAGGGVLSQGALGAPDATNINLTWSKSGSPTGTAKMIWEAYL